MSIFLDEIKLSVKCHRKKHDGTTGGCKNQNGTCGCSCHRVKELQEKLDECFKNDRSHMEVLSQ